MCGIFGIISDHSINFNLLYKVALKTQRRGKDSSGLVVYNGADYVIQRADKILSKLIKSSNLSECSIVFGHGRLATNSTIDNQPIYRDDVIVLHNGIVLNDREIWKSIGERSTTAVDSEVIAALASKHLREKNTTEGLAEYIISMCSGVLNCVVLLPKLGQLILFSNNGSLFSGETGKAFMFASEAATLRQVNCIKISQVKSQISIPIPKYKKNIQTRDSAARKTDLVPALQKHSELEKLLVTDVPEIKRCTKCILPETFPFISFGSNGVCNYCENYKPRSNKHDPESLRNLLDKYRKVGPDADCIIPFSGGRDSSYALHLAVTELNLKPVTYTYDWAMVTDLARRNISLMCGELGVENIIVADDIEKKRRNIKMNLAAFLKSPDLGMLNILTAGDKHFFRHIETVKNELGIRLNIWGTNPLEVTHFKAGFLGVKPDFAEEKVYSSNRMKQVNYQLKRLKAMSNSLGYFNTSLWDTLSGEYYRSFVKKDAYIHIFDYWEWNEEVIDKTLATYSWERAIDIDSTWRIGDGTAAFYNYVYNTIAGFTEHDTFRSNQVREGKISRKTALELVKKENQPRYPNIKWYLDVLEMDFNETINIINDQKRLYYRYNY